MGGGAFANARAPDKPTLQTPRMSPEDYARLKADMTNKLSDYFTDGKVACLKEAPEKQDYGDIDFFIATNERVNWLDLATTVGATGLIDRGSGKCSLAIRKDGATKGERVVQYKAIPGNNIQKHNASDSVTVEAYAQVDVEIIPQELFDWHEFYASYSDLNGLLGRIVTDLGFTVNDKGLCLRLQELDHSKETAHCNVSDKAGMIQLSSDPAKVMEYLGLSQKQYYAGFITMNGFYRWFGECRLLDGGLMRGERKKAHERQRENNRSVYSGFFRDWLPAHRRPKLTGPDYEASDNNSRPSLSGGAENDSTESDTSARLRQRRRDLCAEAVDFFDKRAEYDEKHTALVLKIENCEAVFRLRDIITKHSGKTDKSLGEVLKAFRRYVGFRYGQPIVLAVPHSDAESELYRFLSDDRRSLRDPIAVNEWVQNHWAELRGLERQRTKA